MEMPDKDRPPEEIWLNPEALNAHFEAVKARYASGDDEEVPGGELAQNELTKGLKKRR